MNTINLTIKLQMCFFLKICEQKTGGVQAIGKMCNS